MIFSGQLIIEILHFQTEKCSSSRRFLHIIHGPPGSFRLRICSLLSGLTPKNDELLLAMEESEYEEKFSEIKKACSNVIIIGKATADTDKEEVDNDADDDDADNAEESEGDEFDQETR